MPRKTKTICPSCHLYHLQIYNDTLLCPVRGLTLKEMIEPPKNVAIDLNGNDSKEKVYKKFKALQNLNRIRIIEALVSGGKTSDELTHYCFKDESDDSSVGLVGANAIRGHIEEIKEIGIIKEIRFIDAERQPIRNRVVYYLILDRWLELSKEINYWFRGVMNKNQSFTVTEDETESLSDSQTLRSINELSETIEYSKIPIIVIDGGIDNGKTYEINSNTQRVIIGRNPLNDISFPYDTKVSRGKSEDMEKNIKLAGHAEIFYNDNKHYIKNISRSSKILVLNRGEHILSNNSPEYELEDGTRFKIGTNWLKFRYKKIKLSY